MNKTYIKYVYLITALTIVISCNKDDSGDDYVPLEITTQPDSGEVLQTATVDVAIFSNDTNVPQDGTLTLGATANGTVEIIDNNTPNNRLDDVIRYTPNGSFMGTDTFQYTICDGNGDGCETETVTINVVPVSPVNFDLAAMPYATLTEYNFFEGDMNGQNPVYGVLPYEPISALYTDYAKKKRFVWLPDGVKATYESDDTSLSFPTGSILIKNFYYNNVQPGNTTRVLETRLMIKKADGWIFADYMWNEAQTEATLDTAGDGGFVALEWIQDGTLTSTNYRIPATAECFTCHKSNFEKIPLGVKPQSINSSYNFTDGTTNQLQKWIEQGYLEDNIPGSITTVVDWQDTSEPLELRVRSYFDINCGSCHTDGGHASYRSGRLAFKDTDVPENLGICVDPDTPIVGYETAKVITPGDADNSILFFRMSTNQEQYRMPLLGRTLQHEASVAMIEEWINSLTQTCD